MTPMDGGAMADTRSRVVPGPVWDWMGDAGPRSAGGGAAGQRAREAAAARLQGVIGGAVGLAVAALLGLLLHRRGMALVVGGVALVVALLALAAPLTLYARLRHGLDRLGHWVGTATTWVLMTVLYYLLFLPVGLVMRATGRLGFTRFADPARASYWTVTPEAAAPAADPASYRRQF
jgi:hypothetical protein